MAGRGRLVSPASGESMPAPAPGDQYDVLPPAGRWSSGAAPLGLFALLPCGGLQSRSRLSCVATSIWF
eukprot:530132-Heterocapsa_arctica.AAC.1